MNTSGAEAARTKLFPEPYEKILLVIPIISLFFIPIEFFLNMKLFGEPYKWTRFITDAILLGTIHSALSFALMIFLPEGRMWTKEFGNNNLFKGWLKVISVMIFFFLLFYSIFSFNTPFFVKATYVFVNGFLGIRHWVKQTQGMSFLYLQREKDKEEEKNRISNIVKSEKLFLVYLPIQVLELSYP